MALPAVSSIWLVLSIAMPWLDPPRKRPLSTIAPAMVLPLIAIPVAAPVMAPELLMLPEKFVTALRSMWSRSLELMMPPEKVWTVVRLMPPEMLPELTMPPMKVETVLRLMPLAIAPALEMPPVRVDPEIWMEEIELRLSIRMA